MIRNMQFVWDHFFLADYMDWSKTISPIFLNELFLSLTEGFSGGR